MAKQFKDVNCSRGAPMGRSEYGTPETPARLFRVNLFQGYDDGGAYWGSTQGESLWCLQTEPVWQLDIKMETEESRHFYRASSRKKAYEKALEDYPDLTLKVPVK